MATYKAQIGWMGGCAPWDFGALGGFRETLENGCWRILILMDFLQCDEEVSDKRLIEVLSEVFRGCSFVLLE